MLRKLAIGAASALVLATGAAQAAGEGGHVTNYAFSFDGPFGRFDQDQLQRGLQVFTQVCSGCHGLEHVPLRSLSQEGGIGWTDAEVRAYIDENFIEVWDPELQDYRMATPNDHFPENDGVGAPDLSLMAKARLGFHGPWGTGLNALVNGIGGPEYIASLLTGYTGETVEQYGSVLYENETMEGGLINMAPPLWDGAVEYADGTPATEEQMAQDVAAFLMWTAEPGLMARKQLGLVSVIILGIFSVLLYLTNKRLWAPVKARVKGQSTPAE